MFGIPYAGVLGVITGFLNLIPTFGPLVSYLLIILVTYTQGSSTLTLNPLALTILVWGINVLINQVVRLVIFPRLAGNAVHLPAFFVILGLVIAAVLWGVIGVILVIRLLGTVREALHYVLRKINRHEELRRVEVVLARLVHDSEQAVRLGLSVRYRPVDLPSLECNGIAGVPNAHHEGPSPDTSSRCRRHRLPQEALDPELAPSDSARLVPVNLYLAHEPIG